jgi:hypothetical protein
VRLLESRILREARGDDSSGLSLQLQPPKANPHTLRTFPPIGMTVSCARETRPDVKFKYFFQSTNPESQTNSSSRRRNDSPLPRGAQGIKRSAGR